MRFSILLVAERDDGVAAALTEAGLLVSRADSLVAARTTMVAGAAIFDLVIVDATLPDGDGMDYCAGLRLQGFQGPIVLLGPVQMAEPSLTPVVDDWLPKPIQLPELLARVAAHVSRITASR